MPTRFLRLILPVAVFFVLTSCFSYRDIEVNEISIDNVTMQGSKIIVDFSAMVNNPNRAFVIHQAEGQLNRDQKPFSAAHLLQAIVVPGKSEQRCSGQIQLTILDLMGAFQMGADYRSWDMDPFLFTGDIQIRAAWIKKKFKYNDIPLSQLINKLQ